MTTHAKNLAAALDTEIDRRGGGVKYLTAKQAARELLRQEQAVAELVDALKKIETGDVYNSDGMREIARAALAKHTHKP